MDQATAMERLYEARQRIAKLEELLRHADAKVLWEQTAVRDGFQEEVEKALGIGK